MEVYLITVLNSSILTSLTTIMTPEGMPVTPMTIMTSSLMIMTQILSMSSSVETETPIPAMIAQF